MKTNAELLFALLRNVISGMEISEEEKIAVTENADKLYKLARYHDVAHLLATAFDNSEIEITDENLKKEIQKRRKIAVVRYERLSYELGEVTELFEKENVDFIPLKGVVVRGLYPQPWMRTSCDIDILIHENDLERAISLLVNEKKYEKKSKGTHDVSLFAPSGIHVELHYKLNEDYYDSFANKSLENAWCYAGNTESYTHWYAFNNEFYYFYHVYHMMKHFEKGGCGIRPFLDMYLMNHNMKFDSNKMNELLVNGGLAKFESCCRELSEYWFSNDSKSDIVLQLQKYVLDGGVYGEEKNRITLQQTKSGGKIAFVLDRLILPYDKLKLKYPILKEYKILTPLCQVHRWFRLLTPKTFERSKKELERNKDVSQNDSENMRAFLKNIGLKDDLSD